MCTVVEMAGLVCQCSDVMMASCDVDTGDSRWRGFYTESGDGGGRVVAELLDRDRSGCSKGKIV